MGKKEVQSWLNLSQTASPNGKHDPKSHSTFHSRHIMILPKACNDSCLQSSSCLLSFVTFFCVLISFFNFCQQYFWSIITSCSSNLNFTSLAFFLAKLFCPPYQFL